MLAKSENDWVLLYSEKTKQHLIQQAKKVMDDQLTLLKVYAIIGIYNTQQEANAVKNKREGKPVSQPQKSKWFYNKRK